MIKLHIAGYEMKAIQTRQLTKFYGRTRGIEDLNLEVEEGDIFGFIGPNGAGKSTTIRTLINLIFPSGGSAQVLGLDIIKDSREIRRNIGYIPAEINYYGDMSTIALLNYSASFYQQDCTLRMKELMERFELDHDKKVAQLSSGNKKKLAIIQALLHRPRLLIFDEPTSGLDPLMQNVFFEVLREENQRATIFLSSHVLSEVQRFCNKIAIIKQGKILRVEEIEQLRKEQFKIVTIEFESDEQPSLTIPGIISLERTARQDKFMFKGNLQELLSVLSQTAIENILIEEPSLEDIFMHYYEKEPH